MGLLRELAEAETRQGTCDIHGTYESLHVRGAWSGCPECVYEEGKLISRRYVQEDQERARGLEFENRVGYAAVPPRFKGVMLRSFEVDEANARQVRNRDIAEQYIETFPERRERGEGLILMGGKGNGKTHLVAAIANEIIARHCMTAHYTLATRMFRRIKATFSRDARETESDAISAYGVPDLLVIDEIGMGYCSDTELGHIFEVINQRYEDMKPTILVTNISDSAELEQWIGERVMDRLRESCKAMLFDWESMRKR